MATQAREAAGRRARRELTVDRVRGRRQTDGAETLGTGDCAACGLSFPTAELLVTAVGPQCDMCHTDHEAETALDLTRRHQVVALLATPVPAIVTTWMLYGAVASNYGVYASSAKGAGAVGLLTVVGLLLGGVGVLISGQNLTRALSPELDGRLASAAGTGLLLAVISTCIAGILGFAPGLLL
ncbi:MAG: hypothetical protein ACI8PZ_006671 [Myxococcota bacterium]|jgi:hypothetical protein